MSYRCISIFLRVMFCSTFLKTRKSLSWPTRFYPSFLNYVLTDPRQVSGQLMALLSFRLSISHLIYFVGLSNHCSNFVQSKPIVALFSFGHCTSHFVHAFSFQSSITCLLCSPQISHFQSLHIALIHYINLLAYCISLIQFNYTHPIIALLSL